MLPNIDPKMMKAAMKRMGIRQEEIAANEVIIKSSPEIRIKNPEVIKICMGGNESFQITGEIVERNFSDDDVKTVSEQAKVSIEEAETALRETNGDLAEAIMKLAK